MAQVLSNQWILKRRPHWDRLSSLLAQSDASGLGQLSRAELQEIALLYRQVASDLSVLRQDPTARTYAQYVNQLLARAHHIIYSGRKTNLRTLFLFLRDEYPAIFQRQIGYVAASLLVSVAFGLLGAALTTARPEFMRHFVGPEMIATMERHEMWTKSVVSVAPMASSWIMTNNLSVSFVAAHGALELPSILIAGGAGFRLGHAMLFPGALRWKESVARGGIEATRLVSGIIPLLVIAGTLEGFFSPSQAPVWLKFTVGGLLFTLLNLWLFRPVKDDAQAN